MNLCARHNRSAIVFRRWSRKKFAIFASLGREVLIGHLNSPIATAAGRKNNPTNTSKNISPQPVLYPDEVDEEENSIVSITLV